MQERCDSIKNEQSVIKHISNIDYRAILRNHLILKYISEHPYCTPYQVSGDLNVNYATTSKVIKDLEYLNLISVQVKISENNRTHKECFIPTEKANEEKSQPIVMGGKPKAEQRESENSPEPGTHLLNPGVEK